MAVKTYIRCRPRKDGAESYEITLDHGFFDVIEDGKIVAKRKRTTRTFRGSEVEARVYAEQLRLEAEGVDPFAAKKKLKRMTLRDWNAIYLLHHTANIQESTRAGYRTHLSYFEASPIGDIALDRLSHYVLQDFFDSMLTESPKGTGKPLSPKTIRHVHSALHSSLAEAVRNGLIDKNPSEGIRLPKRDSCEADHYEGKELKKIMKAARLEDPQLQLMISLFAYTGIRRGEGCGLRFKDVDFKGNSIHVQNNRVRGENGRVVEKAPKSARGNRFITVPETLIKMLKKERKRRKENGLPAKYVLATKDGRPLAPDTVTHYWENFLRRHPKIRPLKLHSLRHSQMCLLLEVGVTPNVAAARLGDTTATAMNAYAHSSSRKEKTAAAMLEQALTM